MGEPRLMMEGENPDVVARNATIGAQNDQFRKTWGADFTLPGQIVMTEGVGALSPAWQAEIMVAIQTFDQFDDNNDPYTLRDFGAFDLTIGEETRKFFWKMDLYNMTLDGGSPAPEDPCQTQRVLTIMFPEDY